MQKPMYGVWILWGKRTKAIICFTTWKCMISSGKLTKNLIKMEEILNGIKQIKTRVDSGTITTVNGTETLLSKQLESMLEKAINYTHSCKSDSELLLFSADEIVSKINEQTVLDGETFRVYFCEK